jgi:hypothetical protein
MTLIKRVFTAIAVAISIALLTMPPSAWAQSSGQGASQAEKGTILLTVFLRHDQSKTSERSTNA